MVLNGFKKKRKSKKIKNHQVHLGMFKETKQTRTEYFLRYIVEHILFKISSIQMIISMSRKEQIQVQNAFLVLPLKNTFTILSVGIGSAYSRAAAYC